MKAPVLFLCAALVVSACSRGADPDGLFGGPGGSIDPAAGAGAAGTGAGGPVSPDSPRYLSEVIGDRVLFAVDQANLTPGARATLDQQAAWLRDRPTVTVRIEGHADEQGTREYNLALSNRRASAVRDYLVTRGIDDGRLSILPFGKERPEATCSDERCWSQNRRAVTVVTGGLGA